MHRLNSAYLTEEDIEAQDAGIEISPADFDGPLDVVPVSNPSIFSEAQRFAQTQALMQRASVAPQLYNVRAVEEMFLRTLKVPADEVLIPEQKNENMDPVSENVAATMGSPIYVLPQQDHLAHIMTHLAFLKSPLFGGNPVIMKTLMFPMAIHLRDHLLNYYLSEAHEAVDQAQKQNLIPEQAAQQTQVILQVQQFIEQQLGTFGQELAAIDQAAQQFRPQPPMPPDSSMQIAQLNAQMQGQALQQRAQVDQARIQLDQQKLQLQQQNDAAKIADRQQERAEKLQAEQFKQMAESQRTAAEVAVRERMNTADNDTAKLLAAAEMATGEKVAVSTGTGINPGTR